MYMLKLLYKKCMTCGKEFSSLRKDKNKALSAKQFESYKTCSKECRYINKLKNTNVYEKDEVSDYALIKHKGVEKKIRFDKKDIETINKYKWYIGSHGYAVTYDRISGKKDAKKILMHRLLMGKAGHLVVDHINRDKLDNRKSNLRFLSQARNTFNKTPQRNNKTGFSGVNLHKNGKYIVSIELDNKPVHLGYFCCMEDAVKCRLAAEKLMGLDLIRYK